MARHRIILDCDPGVDDAVALMLAVASPDEVEVLGITAVAGNVPLSATERNARRLCTLLHRDDIPVFAGCSRPIMGGVARGASVHGSDGLGDVDGLPPPSRPVNPKHAVDFIIEAIEASPATITLCPIGPMTNIAVALLKEPEIAAKIREIVFMGGAAFCSGNTSPEAEFNIGFDPHAAHIVMSVGVPLTMFGLDVTRKATITEAWLAELRRGGSLMQCAADMMASYGAGDPCLHDPCVIAYLIDPTLFSGVDALVRVECSSPLTLGRTVAAVSDRSRNGDPPNCRVLTDVDGTRLFSMLGERLRWLDRDADQSRP